eukprot:g20812.t1
MAKGAPSCRIRGKGGKADDTVPVRKSALKNPLRKPKESKEKPQPQKKSEKKNAKEERPPAKQKEHGKKQKAQKKTEKKVKDAKDGEEKTKKEKEKKEKCDAKGTADGKGPAKEKTEKAKEKKEVAKKKADEKKEKKGKERKQEKQAERKEKSQAKEKNEKPQKGAREQETSKKAEKQKEKGKKSKQEDEEVKHKRREKQEEDGKKKKAKKQKDQKSDATSPATTAPYTPVRGNKALADSQVSATASEPPSASVFQDLADFEEAKKNAQKKGVGRSWMRHSAQSAPAWAPAWKAKVEELSMRGMTLNSFLDFYQEDLSSITLNRAGARRAEVMVTHNWGNNFNDLLAAVISDNLQECSFRMAGQLLREDSHLLREILTKTGRLNVSYWICAFAVNQHMSICHSNPYDRDPLTNELHPVCRCSCVNLVDSDGRSTDSEINKFDDMMYHLASTGSCRQVIAVDQSFDLFQRAWCVAEIAEAKRLHMRQSLKLLSKAAIEQRAQSLGRLDIRNMGASSEKDKELILGKIGSIDHFNAELQSLIFDPKSGLGLMMQHWLIMSLNCRSELVEKALQESNVKDYRSALEDVYLERDRARARLKSRGEKDPGPIFMTPGCQKTLRRRSSQMPEGGG